MKTFRILLTNVETSFTAAIQREEEKVKRSLKEAAKKGDKDVCTILAKEVIRARKTCTKIYTSKAHLNSVSLQMKNQLATIRVAGSLSKSTEVMQAMQSLVKVPEVAATMREMSKEMMKAGIIEEMLDETMDSIEDSEEMEDEAQEEVDKVSKNQRNQVFSSQQLMTYVCFVYYKGSLGGDRRTIGNRTCGSYRNTWSPTSNGIFLQGRRS